MINKYLIKFYLRLFKSYTKKRFKNNSDEVKRQVEKIEKVAIIYSIPKDSPRINTWNDGFVDAIRKLEDKYSVTWINTETEFLTFELLNKFDFILVKSNWNWGPDKIFRENFRSLKVRKGLAIAGVSIPPSVCEMKYYDVLWYETNWYKKIIQNHPNIYHGFGINKNSLIPHHITPKYDYITIGAFLPHKRMHLLNKLKGKILVLGEKYNTPYSNKIISALKKNENIHIMPFVEYSNLAKYLCLAKTMYIPASIDGGGERAILEARHCGLNIKIENDNPKLREIVDSPIWDSDYYARQLEKGMKSLI